MDEQPSHERLGSPIRVLAANLPEPFVEQLQQSASPQREIEVLRFVGSNIELLLAARGIDILLYGASQAKPLPPICTNLLAEFNDLRIILLVDAGSAGARLYWLGLRTRWLGEVSSAGLLTVLHRAYRLNHVE